MPCSWGHTSTVAGKVRQWEGCTRPSGACPVPCLADPCLRPNFPVLSQGRFIARWEECGLDALGAVECSLCNLFPRLLHHWFTGGPAFREARWLSVSDSPQEVAASLNLLWVGLPLSEQRLRGPRGPFTVLTAGHWGWRSYVGVAPANSARMLMAPRGSVSQVRGLQGHLSEPV